MSETKTVTFLGNVYHVPLWTNYMTNDCDGVYAWELEPILSSDGNEYVRAERGGDAYGQHKCIAMKYNRVVCQAL